MISVENFYWALFENLLKPTGLDCWYCFPWGTQDNLSKLEFKKLSSIRDYNHVLFYFDQEPLWSHELGPYDLGVWAWSAKRLKILANSEHSVMKQQTCRSRGMLDWYFFYHGFAALDWFRDTQYIDTGTEINDVFLCLNHNVKARRVYRLDLLARIVENGVHDKGTISLLATGDEIMTELSRQDGYLTEIRKSIIVKNLVYQNLPWQVDMATPNATYSARCGHEEYRLWQKSLFHVVTETVFYEPKLHLTEKIFKPIVTLRPFVLVAAPGNLAYLRRYGFQTFDRWIDESYDMIQDPDLRLDAIVSELTRLANMSLPQLRMMHQDMQIVLYHNKQHFFGEFRDIIVNELVNNFDQCIRIWNNGRIDDRDVALHPDLESVKRTLLL